MGVGSFRLRPNLRHPSGIYFVLTTNMNYSGIRSYVLAAISVNILIICGTSFAQGGRQCSAVFGVDRNVTFYDRLWELRTGTQTKDSFSKEIEYAKLIVEILKYNSVEFSAISSEGKTVFKISSEGSAPTSKLAALLKKNYFTELILDPQFFAESQADAAVYASSNQIFMVASPFWLLKTEGSLLRESLVLHEMRHVWFQGRRKSGVLSPYDISINAYEGVLPHGLKSFKDKVYEDSISLEELRAFQTTFYLESLNTSKLLRGSPSKGDVDHQVKELIRYAHYYLSSIQRVANVIGAKNAQKLREQSTELDVDGNFVQLWDINLEGNFVRYVYHSKKRSGNGALKEFNELLPKMESLVEKYRTQSELLIPLIESLSSSKDPSVQLEIVKDILSKTQIIHE